MRQIFTYLMIVIPFLGFSQYEDLQIPINMMKSYKDKVRSFDGKPGVNYWINKPVYDIDLEFNPANSILSGSEKIIYTNNSPDSLDRIVLTLLGDIYNKDNHMHDWNIDRNTLHDGVKISKIIVRGKEVNVSGEQTVRTNTNLIIKLEEKIPPKTEIGLNIEWTYEFPYNSVIRSGNYGDSTYMISYFYPKIAVYDDIDGWDLHNYTGFGEFYGEYADYDVNITVPGDFKVWATGELQNPEKVLSKKYLKRWKEAHNIGKTIKIIDKEEAELREVTLQKSRLTWHYKAYNVPDFAFGTSNKFRWDAKSVVVDKETGRKVFLSTAYEKNRVHYPKVIEILDSAIMNYSTDIPGIPYPYPSMKIFNGNAGMEFPGMCNDAEDEESGIWNIGLTYHEVAHTYFPFFVGTNERKYAWMDEGWASFFPLFYWEKHIDKSVFDYFASRLELYKGLAGRDLEVPIFTLVDLLRIRSAYRQASYNKPFLAYYYLYTYLGKEKFLKTLKTYMNDWSGKHPIPFDFFYSFNTASGENLNWFWKNWFFDRGYADLGISMKDNKLVVTNIGQLALPVIITFEYSDGTKKKIEYNMKVWKNNKSLSIPVKDIHSLKKITLGNDTIIDIDKNNNEIIFNQH